jgi:hypothetical protein
MPTRFSRRKRACVRRKVSLAVARKASDNQLMALIQRIERVVKERQSVHRPTRCLASEFIGPQNKKYLQLDTYGSDDREFPEKISQAIQIDEEGARELLLLINSTFPNLAE